MVLSWESDKEGGRGRRGGTGHNQTGAAEAALEQMGHVTRQQRPVYLDAIDGRAKQALQQFVAKQEKSNGKRGGKRAVHYALPPPPPPPFRYARGDHKLQDGVKCVRRLG